MDLLAMYAASQPKKPAVIDDRPGEPVVNWSFAELDRRANQLGHYLLGLGVDPATKVVWCGQNSAGVLAMTHAIRKIGAIGVPLNYRLSPEEAAYVIDNSDAKVVYVDAEYAPLISQVRDRVPKVTDVLVYDGDGALESHLEQLRSTPPSAVETAEAIPSSMIYTSGTTGKPKGALRRATV